MAEMRPTTAAVSQLACSRHSPGSVELEKRSTPARVTPSIIWKLEPGYARKAEKYGMPIEYADRIVERYFGVLGKEQAIHAAAMAQNIRVGPALADALARNPKTDHAYRFVPFKAARRI